MHVLEKAFKWRPRIEHAQIMTLEDIERIGRLGGELFSPSSFLLVTADRDAQVNQYICSDSERAAYTCVSRSFLFLGPRVCLVIVIDIDVGQVI